MKKFMLENPYVPLIAAVLIGIIAVWTAFYQIKKEKKDAVDRNNEFKQIIGKNNTVLEDTKCLLEDTKNLLDKADTTIKGQSIIHSGLEKALKDLQLQLVKSDNIIISQSSMLDKQTETIQYLIGTDSIPDIGIQVEPFLDSYAIFQIIFSVYNKDHYPIHHLYANLVCFDDKELDEFAKRSNTGDQLKVELASRDSEIKNIGPIEVTPNTPTLLKKIYFKFPEGKERITVHLNLDWPRGNLSMAAEVHIDDFHPGLALLDFTVKGENDKAKYSKLIKFKNGFKPEVIKQIKINRSIGKMEEDWNHLLNRKKQQ